MFTYHVSNDDQPIAGERIGDDLLVGVPRIAAELNQTTRSTHHLIQRGLLPTFKLGRQRAAFKSKLRAHLVALSEAAALAA